MMMLMKNITRL